MPARDDMMDPPIISVIVIAYDRREYLGKALASVYDQTLSADSYEVKLLTNFPVDAGLTCKPNLQHLQTDVKELEVKLAQAVGMCRGEIICILEDDDEWEKERLQLVLEAFARLPGLAFYHNNFKVIDDKSSEATRATLRVLQKRMHRIGELLTDRNGASFGTIRRMIKSGVNFNLSSMAMSREVLQAYSRQLSELNGRNSNVDTFLFFAALVSGQKLYADDRELTRYRIHDRNISSRFILEGMKPEDLGYPALLGLAGSARENVAIRRSIECMVSDLMFEIYSRDKVRDRGKMAREIINHLRYFSIADMQYDILLVLFGLLYVVSPSLGDMMHSIPDEHL